MTNLEESHPDQMDSLLTSVYRQEKLDCVFQLCGLQKIQVECKYSFLWPRTSSSPHCCWLYPSDHATFGSMQKMPSICGVIILPRLMLAELAGGHKSLLFSCLTLYFHYLPRGAVPCLWQPYRGLSSPRVVSEGCLTEHCACLSSRRDDFLLSEWYY